MHLSTRYWIFGAGVAFLIIFMLHRYVISYSHHNVTCGPIPNTDHVQQGVDPKDKIQLANKQKELEEIKRTLHSKILKEILNMSFYDGPMTTKCDSHTNLIRTKDSEECLAANTVFFLETSDSPSLNARQACAVESAAKHLSEWKIKVMSTSNKPLNLTDPFMKVLSTFDNVQFRRMQLQYLMQGTPLWYWYQKGDWKTSPHKIVHLSDAIRLCLLWKYGGIYLDTDVVVLRSLSQLHNTVSFDSGTNLGNSFLAFDQGQSLLRYTLIDYAASYNPHGFATNGPVLLNRNFREHCEPNTNNATDNKCHVNVLPKESVYPIDYNKWEEYFKSQTATLSWTAFKSSYIIHVWNKMSSGGKMVVGQNSWYELAMRTHCPNVYKLVADIGYA